MPKVILITDKETPITLNNCDFGVVYVTPGTIEEKITPDLKAELIILDCQFQQSVLEQIQEYQLPAIIVQKWQDVHSTFKALPHRSRFWTTTEDIQLIIHKLTNFQQGVNIVKPDLLSPEEIETGVILKDPSHQTFSQQLFIAAKSDKPVLITGPTGTGKNALSKFIHQNSRRANGPFIVANCPGFTAELLESVLFGHKKGAFTGSIGNQTGLFEQASNGTLVLDEIGDVDVKFQAKLLQAIQENTIKPIGGDYKTINTRVILATNRNVEEEIKVGRFREDLYNRVISHRLHLSPLNERRGDIPALIQQALRETKATALHLEPQAWDFLLNQYPWPGNIRWLKTFFTTLANTYSSSELITMNDVLNLIETQPDIEDFFRCGALSLQELEEIYKVHVLEYFNGDTRRAANLLKIPMSHLK